MWNPIGLTLQSSYNDYKNSRHPDFTNFTEDFRATLDYILHTEYLKPQRLLPVPSARDLKGVKYLPNEDHPSDHLPILTEFILLDKQ